MSDDEAITYLWSVGYKTEWGVIRGPLPLVDSKAEEAIDLLCNEWDFEFSATGESND